MSDAQIFNSSEVKSCFEDGTINLPPPQPMTNDDREIPFFMLADDAFCSSHLSDEAIQQERDD